MKPARSKSLLTCLICISLQTRGSNAFASQQRARAIRTSTTPSIETKFWATANDGENSSNNKDISEEVLKSLTEKLDKSKKSAEDAPKKKDNKAMQFLRKVGRVGGAANKNFVNAVGSDEGSTGRQPPAQRSTGMSKSKAAFQECTKSGTIDDLSETFPFTSSGTEWRGVSDRVMGGLSNGFIKRETDLQGKAANLLTGHVSLENNGGFIQMVTDLALDPSKSISVDASEYDGIELEVLCRHEPREFNVHLRTPGALKQASYRCSCKVEESDAWETIRVPFSSFKCSEDGMPPLDISELRRIGIVAIGKEMDVYLAIARVKFYVVI